MVRKKLAEPKPQTALSTDMRLTGKNQKTAAFAELGRTGLLQFGGMVSEEFLFELKGWRWRRIVNEMLINDPVVSTMFGTIDLLTRGVDWTIKPGGEDSESKSRAEFVTGCMDDMSTSWKDSISEMTSFIPWGWAYHETVYKQRLGENPGSYRDEVTGREEQLPTSKFDDNKIGWRKVPIRSQDSLERWEFDDKGGIQGLWQNTIYSRAFVPIDKSLLFRTSVVKNNPEGASVCRRIYRPWYYKQRIENIEGIGIERDLAGLPTGTCPSDYLSPTASEDKKAIRRHLEKILGNVRNDEQAFMLFPSDVFTGTNVPMFSVKLLSTGGTRQFDTNKIIQRYDQRILMTLVLDFLLLGHEKVGSFALASSKTELFSIALGGFLDIICDIFNRHAIPRLLRLNGMPTEKPPTLTHGDVETVDLKELGAYIANVSDTKVSLDEDQQKWLLKQANIPVIDGKPLPKKPTLVLPPGAGGELGAGQQPGGKQAGLPFDDPAGAGNGKGKQPPASKEK